MRRNVPVLITFLTGILIVVTFFVPHRPFGDLEQRFLVWYSIVVGFTLLLGMDSLIKYHLQKIKRQQAGWEYSIVTVFGVIITLIFGFYSWHKYGTPLAIGSPFMWLYTNMLVPLQATMFSLLAFFIASAAYRAFRARTLEATLLLIAATIVMLGRVPLGEALGIKLPVMADWIMDIPQTAAKRGILIGTYLGAVAMSFRVILGIERTYLSA